MVSIEFNDIDLSTYDLEIHTLDLMLTKERKSIQLQDRAYSFGGIQTGRTIVAGCRIFGADLTDVLKNLDNIYSVLNVRGPRKLSFGHQDDRYWLAEFESLTGPFDGIGAYDVEIVFYAADPLAYGNTKQVVTQYVNNNSFTFNVDVNGTAETSPVISMTFSSNANPNTFMIENITIGEAFYYSPATLTQNQVVIIDCNRWYAESNNQSVMKDVDGTFLKMIPGNNTIKVLNGNPGILKIEYYPRYV